MPIGTMNAKEINEPSLQVLEEDIFGRWQNRISDHLPDVLPKLFGTETCCWPWRRLSWTISESSRRSDLKDLGFRPCGPTAFLDKVPFGRELKIVICSGKKMIGCINTAFISSRLDFQGELPVPSRIVELNATRAKIEGQMDVPCFHAFAGVFDRSDLEVPERSVVLNWRPDLGAWDYREGKDAGLLCRLFFPHTDQECAKRVVDCLSTSGSSLIMASRLCRACGISEMQLEFLSLNIPGARLFSDHNARFFEIAANSWKMFLPS